MENTQFLKTRHKKTLVILLVVIVLMLSFGCSFYGGIKGTVVDNATGTPVEGAVVVAQWRKLSGLPGMAYSNLHKITETLTDKDGKFSLSGTIGFMLEPPEMIVCKEGYIPWRNDMVFQSERENDSNKHNEWKNHQTYRLDKFTGTGKDIIWLSTFSSYGFRGTERGKTPEFDKHISKLVNAKFDEMKKLSNK